MLVLHAWWGLNAFFRSLCDRLAAAGFVAVAPNLWGGAVATTVAEAEALLQQSDSSALAQAATASLAYLRAHPAVRGTGLGAIGCSMGAAWALTLAGAHPELRAVTLFYGSGEADLAASQASFLGHFAEHDPWEPDEDVRRMEAALRGAGRAVRLHRYAGAGHWFFEADRAEAYRPAAADLAWERTLAFLREQLAA